MISTEKLLEIIDRKCEQCAQPVDINEALTSLGDEEADDITFCSKCWIQVTDQQDDEEIWGQNKKTDE